MNSKELVEACPGLTYRKLDFWCNRGVFGEQKAVGSLRRHFDDDEERVARVLGRVSAAFGQWSGGKGGFVGVYREIAVQVAAGAPQAVVKLNEGVSIVVDVEEPV